jgi:RimJ/RimL family protein N-acetyltransferase
MDASRYEAKGALKDGCTVVIRSIRPDDKSAVAAAFQRLSAHSVYLRLFSPKPTLTEADLKWLTEVDFEKTVALVIELDEGHSRTLIGGGRYVEYDSKDSVRTAELAFTVSDEFQGKGLGKILMQHLASIGRAKGVARFEAIVLAENRGMLGVFTASGLPMRTESLGGEVKVTLSLEEAKSS